MRVVYIPMLDIPLAVNALKMLAMMLIVPTFVQIFLGFIPWSFVFTGE